MFQLGRNASIGAIALLLATAGAQGAQVEADLGANLEQLLVAHGAKVAQGVLVQRLSDGKVLFQKEATQLLAPASVTKVVTSAAVLTKLSPVYTFKTQLFYTGQRKNDRILGDLIVVGDGDPFIVSEKLWQLAADLKNLGIREFTGDLVVDNSLFDSESRDASRQGGLRQSSNAYDAPVSAFAVNFNTFAVVVAPGERPGRSALVSLDPYPLRGVIVENSVLTTKAGAHKSLQVTRRLSGKEERLQVSGTIALDTPLQKIYRSVSSDVQASGENLKAFLKHAGVIVAGGVKPGVKPAAATLLITLDSYEMRKIVAGLNTFSNNFIADVLVKRLGAAFPLQGVAEARGSGSFVNGVQVLRDFLVKDVGVTSAFVLENGSGLATENRLSARQVVDVLAYMARHMEVFPEFLASLPATGWDGTLKKRFGKGDTVELKGLIRAKTGTLTEPIAVSAIAGYFRHPTHGMVAFCILENGQEGAAQPAVSELRDRQDQVLTAFMNQL